MYPYIYIYIQIHHIKWPLLRSGKTTIGLFAQELLAVLQQLSDPGDTRGGMHLVFESQIDSESHRKDDVNQQQRHIQE